MNTVQNVKDAKNWSTTMDTSASPPQEGKPPFEW